MAARQPTSQVRMSMSWQDFCRMMGLLVSVRFHLPRTKEWAMWKLPMYSAYSMV